MTLQLTAPPVDATGPKYRVGDEVHTFIRLTRSTVASVMRGCGLRDVDVHFAPLNPKCKFGDLFNITPRGF